MDLFDSFIFFFKHILEQSEGTTEKFDSVTKHRLLVLVLSGSRIV